MNNIVVCEINIQKHDEIVQSHNVYVNVLKLFKCK